jgi:hypothetical protein
LHIPEPYIVVTVIAVAFVLLWLIGGTVARRREKKLVDSRPSENVETFVAAFRSEVQLIARAMYAEFQEYTFSGKVPLRKSDRPAKILKMGGGDLDDALQRVANQFGCRKPNEEDDRKFRGRETLEHFVEFVHYLRAPKT